MSKTVKRNQSNEFKDMSAVCRDCGDMFTITAKEQKFAAEDKGFVLPKRCSNCRDARKLSMKTIVCKDCGKEFMLSINEQDYFNQHGLKEPVRCYDCRQIRKNNNK